MLAVYYNNPSFIRKLLAHGADINITGLNKDDNVHKSEARTITQNLISRILICLNKAR